MSTSIKSVGSLITSHIKTTKVTVVKSNVTQATSATTDVTMNGGSSAGVITLFSSTLASNTSSVCNVLNAGVASGSVVLVGIANYSGAGTPLVRCGGITNGSFTLTLVNIHPTVALNGVVSVSVIIV